jgi:hypothetical protein
MEWSEDQNNSLYPALIGIFALVLAMTAFFNTNQLAEVAAAGTDSKAIVLDGATSRLFSQRRLPVADSSLECGDFSPLSKLAPSRASAIDSPAACRQRAAAKPAQGAGLRSAGASRWLASKLAAKRRQVGALQKNAEAAQVAAW